MSSIRRGETILMAWHCFISSSRNIQFLSNLSRKQNWSNHSEVELRWKRKSIQERKKYSGFFGRNYLSSGRA
jgi:hypothetical protein